MKILLTIFIVLSFSSAFSAEPAPIIQVTQIKKVLGRGIQDKHADEAIQIACVGKPKFNGSIEPSCNELRYILKTKAGGEYLIGPKMMIRDGGNVSDQIRTELADFQLLAVQQNLKFSPFVWLTTFGSGGVTGRVETGPTWYVNDGEYYFARGIRDLLKISTDFFFDRSFGKLGISNQNIQEAFSKTVDAWSIRPTPIKSSRFQLLKTLLLGTSIGQYYGACPFLKDKKTKPEIFGIESHPFCKIVMKGDDLNLLLSDPNSFFSFAQDEAGIFPAIQRSVKSTPAAESEERDEEIEDQ